MMALAVLHIIQRSCGTPHSVLNSLPPSFDLLRKRNSDIFKCLFVRDING